MVATGLQMLESIKEIKSQMANSEQVDYKSLEIRVGIHTGNIIAGMIGTKLVKYDIFGENVLIASKMRLNTAPGSVCISQETMNLLGLNSKISKNYEYEEYKTFRMNTNNMPRRLMKMFTVHQALVEDSEKEQDSDADSNLE